MMKTIKLILLLSALFTLSGCPDKRKDDFVYDVIVTDVPANLNNLNSIYDDYNSVLPYPASRYEIYFSSNRNSSGNNFDIVAKSYDISYHEEENKLNIETNINDDPSYSIKLFQLTNTNYNELGPFTHKDNHNFFLMYANDEKGNYDIKYVYTNEYDWGTNNSQEKVYGPFNIEFLNSGFDDLYPIISVHNQQTIIYFCSNRQDSIFHIYKATIPVTSDYVNYFKNTDSATIELDTILSSDKDDKCPSGFGNIIVFASNREGGYGGFDLWYSQFLNNKWNMPVNFGPVINTEFDEYRPIIEYWGNFTIMIFSSNRPGGKGGFDLYCVKLPIKIF